MTMGLALSCFTAYLNALVGQIAQGNVVWNFSDTTGANTAYLMIGL
jgi:hypothetical protein